MLRKTMTLMLVGATLAPTACNTVRGAGEDLQSVANTTEEAMN